MRAVASFAFTILIIAGCNTVAGIEPAGVRKSEDPDGDQLSTSSQDEPQQLAPPTSDGAPAPALAHDAGPPGPCDKYPNAKLCDGKCVYIDDPNYGCTPTSCMPCMLPHASAKCGSDLKCVIAQCTDDDWGDCDGKAENGCEVDLDSTANCGGCGSKCASTQTCSHGSCI